MEKITNSPVKESIRIKNEHEGQRQIYEVRRQAGEKRRKIEDEAREKKRKLDRSIFNWIDFEDLLLPVFCGSLVIDVIEFFFLIYRHMFRFQTFLIMMVVNAILVLAFEFIAKAINRNKYSSVVQDENQRIDALNKETGMAIHKIEQEMDAKTRKEIQQYDRDVQENVKRIAANRVGLERMEQYCEQLFHKAIQYEGNNAGCVEQYIAFNFVMAFSNDRIRVNCIPIGQYVNSSTFFLGEYNFIQKRYRVLNLPTECEALGTVVTKMMVERLKNQYPKQKDQFRLSHIDAEVTIGFCMPNVNYQPNTVII